MPPAPVLCVSFVLNFRRGILRDRARPVYISHVPFFILRGALIDGGEELVELASANGLGSDERFSEGGCLRKLYSFHPKGKNFRGLK